MNRVGIRKSFRAAMLVATAYIALLFTTPAAQASAITWILNGNGNWNTTTANWMGDATTFTDDGTVDVAFTNAAGGTITITANMSPLSTTVDGPGTYQFNGGPIDSGSLIKSGTGLLRLNCANTFSGGTTINAGTLELYNFLKPAGSGTIYLGNSTPGNTDNATFSPATTGVNAPNLVVVQSGGTGTLTLSGAATDGQVFAGPIMLQKDLTIKAIGDRTFTLTGDISGTGNITLVNTHTNERFYLSMTNLNPVGSISTAGTGGSGLTIGANIGANVTTINKLTGTGMMVLSGTNVYTGATQVSAGTLKFAKPVSWSQNFGGVSGTPSPITVSNAGSMLGINFGPADFSNANVTSILANTTFGTGTGLTVDTDNSGGVDNTLSTDIGTGVSGPQNLTKLGNGNLILTGTNLYTGVTTLRGGASGPGILVAGVAEIPGVSDPFGNPATPAGSIIFDGGGLGWSAANTIDYSPRFTINSGKSYIFDTRSQSVTLASILPVNGINGLTKNGVGTMTLTGANLYSGVTTIGRDTLIVSSINNIASPLASSNLGRPTTSANGQITIGSRDVASPILRYNGTGETTDRIIKLGQDDHNAGGTLDQSGTGLLKFTGDATTGIAVTTSDGGPTLTLQGSSAGVGEISGVVQRGGGAVLAVTKAGTNTWILSGTNRYNGVTTINGGILSVNTLGNAALTPTLTTTAGSATVTASSTVGLQVGQTIVSPKIPDGRTIASITDGTTLVLNSGTSVTAGTTQTSYIGFANSLGLPALASSTIAIGSGITTGQLTYTGSAVTTDRAVNLAGTTGGATLDQSGTGLLKFTSAFTATGAGSKTLFLQGSGTGEIAGAIVNNSSVNKTGVTKLGTGTWILSGVNTYTGPTTVSKGVLGGAGTIAGAVLVAADAALAPGPMNGIGTLTVGGAVDFADGARLSVDANGASTDLLAVTGNVTGSGTVTVAATVSGAGPWLIMTAANIAPTFITTDASRYTLKKLSNDTQLLLVKKPATVICIR